MSSDLVHHGVQYTVSSEPPKAHLPVDELGLRGIKYVRIQWVDLINHIKYRVVPIAYFEKLLQTSRPGSSLTKATLGIVFVTVSEGFSSTGECLYALDLSTLRLCPYAPGHASVMGWFEEKQPKAGLSGRRAVEMDICPRTILRRVVENAKELSGIEFLIGFETEFILLNKISPIEAVNPHGWCDSKALLSGSKEAAVLEEIADCLTASGVELQMYHGEGAPGQYEVVTGPLTPLQAVDALIHTRETIYNVASKHGMTATLAPRIFLDSCGSATHAHISVHAPNETSEPSSHANLTALEEHLLAGILAHLSSLTLLLMPTSASYARMRDGVWSGGTYVCWGTDDKEAPLRLCNAASPSSR
ncbi:hypothetical protein NLJ89_g9467 [Agrocybe chaxingu]|uniref:Glutamine synthetase n=1 Tax=Agrocybe chaxingu TaxID=84603 RepID=A0A9W8JVS4_9AGAR|nr:hypothetical protein NLJ89_g9467 [Agrocybe chaxingu]